VADYLASLGFARHSLSDIVREQAAGRGLSPTREHLIRIGNELRAEGGAGVLAERIRPRLGTRDVVDSIRNPVEVAVLRGVPRFVLVGVRAPVELRFARSRLRARVGDPTTLAEFEARERQENGDVPTAQRLSATFALADVAIDNDGDLDRLHRRIDRLLAEQASVDRPLDAPIE
jgi:dephospho-CoA kinase